MRIRRVMFLSAAVAAVVAAVKIKKAKDAEVESSFPEDRASTGDGSS